MVFEWSFLMDFKWFLLGPFCLVSLLMVVWMPLNDFCLSLDGF